LPEDWRDDVRSGLNVIGNRCDALNRFTGAYARLARLPAPKLQPVRVADWIGRVVKLEQRMEIELSEGADITIQADPDQLEQLLINILRNAVDATLERNGNKGSVSRECVRGITLSKFWWTIRAMAFRTPRICSFRSSRPSLEDRAIGLF